jgi:WXG100 family type VII secretion target
MVQQMVVTFAALQDVERGIRECGDKLRGDLDELAADLTPLMRRWQGEAADACRERMADWRAAADDLADALSRIAGMVRTAESNYRTAVSTNKSIWPVR